MMYRTMYRSLVSSLMGFYISVHFSDHPQIKKENHPAPEKGLSCICPVATPPALAVTTDPTCLAAESKINGTTHVLIFSFPLSVMWGIRFESISNSFPLGVASVSFVLQNALQLCNPVVWNACFLFCDWKGDYMNAVAVESSSLYPLSLEVLQCLSDNLQKIYIIMDIDVCVSLKSWFDEDSFLKKFLALIKMVRGNLCKTNQVVIICNCVFIKRDLVQRFFIRKILHVDISSVLALKKFPLSLALQK